MIKIISAMDNNRGIGYNNGLLCHLPADLEHFKTMTTGQLCVFGRTTYEGLPKKPLPNRESIVLTKNKFYKPEGADVAHHELEILQIAKDRDVWICGGAEIYKTFLPYADEMILTFIHETFSADTFFPHFNGEGWKYIATSTHAADEKNPVPYTFAKLVKIESEDDE